jgi:hypothetical protein
VVRRPGALDLELGAEVVALTGPLEILSSQAGRPWNALRCAYDRPGFDHATGGDEIFRQLVLARIIDPDGKIDALRVLTEAGMAPASYPTLKRRLPVYAKSPCRQHLAAACARNAALGRRRCALRRVDALLRD